MPVTSSATAMASAISGVYRHILPKRPASYRRKELSTASAMSCELTRNPLADAAPSSI